jgi:peptidyl-prolyl cis-trans isomerase SurA
VEKVLNKEVASKIKVSDGDIADYYNQHKAEFNLIAPQYHLAQILVTTQPSPQVRNLKNDKAQNESEAKKKVAMLMTRLQSGEDFATLATNYSEQPDTSASGGDLGFIAENTLQGDKQAYEAIGRLKPGEFTAALPAADGGTHQVFGYRIIKLISKEPAGQRELNDPRVQKAIGDQLRDRREQLLKSAYDESLHNKSKIENYLADQILKDSGQ